MPCNPRGTGHSPSRVNPIKRSRSLIVSRLVAVVIRIAPRHPDWDGGRGGRWKTTVSSNSSGLIIRVEGGSGGRSGTTTWPLQAGQHTRRLARAIVTLSGAAHSGQGNGMTVWVSGWSDMGGPWAENPMLGTLGSVTTAEFAPQRTGAALKIRGRLMSIVSQRRVHAEADRELLGTYDVGPCCPPRQQGPTLFVVVLDYCRNSKKSTNGVWSDANSSSGWPKMKKSNPLPPFMRSIAKSKSPPFSTSSPSPPNRMSKPLPPLR